MPYESPPHLRLVGEAPPDFADKYVEVLDFFQITAQGKPVGTVAVQFNFDNIPPQIHMETMVALLKERRKVELEARPSLTTRLWRALKG